MAYGDLKVRNLIWNTGSGDNTVVLNTLATQSYVTTGFAPKANPTFTGTVNGADLVLSGNLTVNGTQTIINTQTLDVEDKQIEIGKVSSPSDTTADQGGWKLKGATDKTFLWVNATDAWTSSEHIHLGDNKKLLLGTGSDFQIYHNGSTSFLTDGIGDLRIRGDAVKIQSASGENSARFIANGAVELYYDNSKKFETTANGVSLSDRLYMADSKYIYMGAGNDFYMGHNGTDNYLVSSNGSFNLHMALSELAIKANNAGSVELYYDNSKKLETTSLGVTVTGTVSDSKGDLRSIPANTQGSNYSLASSDAGKCVLFAGTTLSVPTDVGFVSGDAVTIINNSASEMSFSLGAAMTMYNTADGTEPSKLAARGMATIYFVSNTVSYISGAGLS